MTYFSDETLNHNLKSVEDDINIIISNKDIVIRKHYLHFVHNQCFNNVITYRFQYKDWYIASLKTKIMKLRQYLSINEINEFSIDYIIDTL